MGAKDLEWRTGGTGGGAADGGRDLEAKFFTPSADDEIESELWWIAPLFNDGGEQLTAPVRLKGIRIERSRAEGYDPTIGITHEGRDGSSKFVM